MARLLRFDRAVGLLTAPDPPSLAVVAHQAGYYDQAHFANEVRGFCGLTPSGLIAREVPDRGGILEPLVETPGAG